MPIMFSSFILNNFLRKGLDRAAMDALSLTHLAFAMLMVLVDNHASM
jgi:hypothetical protein